MDIGTLVMKIKADTAGFESGINKAKDLVASAGKAVAIGTAAIATGIGAVSAKAISMGADAEEMRNKYDVVFSGMTATVDSWANNFASAVGRSKFDIQESVSNIADLQQGLGMTREESFNLAKQVVELGTDLASFNNLNDSDAIEAVSKAMLGEAESAKQLGLLLNVDRVKKYAEEQGLVYENLTDAERAQQVYNLAVRQSQNAIGDASRSAGSYTNQMKALKTGISDAITTVGMKMVPFATGIVSSVNENILPAFTSFLEKSIDVGSKVGDWLTPKVEQFTNSIKNNWPSIKDIGEDVFNGIKNGAESFSGFIEKKLLPVVGDVYNWFVDNGGTIKKIGEDAFNGIEVAANGLWSFAETYLMPVIASISDFIIDNYPAMKDTAESVFSSIERAIEPVADIIFNRLLPALGEIVETEFGDFLINVEKTFSTAADIFNFLADSVNLVVDAIGALNKIMPKTDAFQTTLSDFTPKGIMQNLGFLPSGNEQESVEEYYNSKYGSTPKNVTPTTSSSQAKPINMYITGNNVMNERDADGLGELIVRQLRYAGVK